MLFPQAFDYKTYQNVKEEESKEKNEIVSEIEYRLKIDQFDLPN
jgi:hypothetical protein